MNILDNVTIRLICYKWRFDVLPPWFVQLLQWPLVPRPAYLNATFFSTKASNSLRFPTVSANPAWPARCDESSHVMHGAIRANRENWDQDRTAKDTSLISRNTTLWKHMKYARKITKSRQKALRIVRQMKRFRNWKGNAGSRLLVCVIYYGNI